MSFNNEKKEQPCMTQQQYNQLLGTIQSVEGKVEEMAKTVQSLVVWAAGDDKIKTHGVERKLQDNKRKLEELNGKLDEVNSKTNKILYVFLGIYIVTMTLAAVFGIDLSPDCPYPHYYGIE